MWIQPVAAGGVASRLEEQKKWLRSCSIIPGRPVRSSNASGMKTRGWLIAPRTRWSELPTQIRTYSLRGRKRCSGRMVDATENKLRWNLALMVPRMALTVAETERAAVVLRSWLDDRSSIVKTCAMQGLAGLTRWNPAMLPEVLDMLRLLSRSGTPAMRARGRILLKRIESRRRVTEGAHKRP